MSDEHDRRDAELREALRLVDDAPPVRPSATVRDRILAYAREGRRGRTGPTAWASRRRRPHRAVTAIAAVAVVATAAMAVALTVGVGTWTSGGAPPDPDGAPSPPPLALRIGDPFPDFTATDIATGAPLSLDDLEGNVVLLNIWATWCPPCETEMPSMERLHRELAPKGLSVVAVSVDQESTSLVRRWVAERDLTFTVLHDREGRFERSFLTAGVPESFVIDRDGRLAAREIGPRMWDSPEHGSLVRRLVETDG